MAFIDVFERESRERKISGVPKKDNDSFKVYVLEYLLQRMPDGTSEKQDLIYQYETYNIGDSIVEFNADATVGPPVPNTSSAKYLKTDGSNTMDSGYIPINPLSVITKQYFETNGSGLILGTGATNAYYGDKGNIAYNHSLLAHAPSNAEANRPISSSLVLNSSSTSASSAAVYALNNNKSEATHNHAGIYEPANANIQSHIADSSIHFSIFIGLSDVPGSYSGQQGKLVKVNATEDGLIFGDPSGTTVSWGDISGTLSNQTDLSSALAGKVDDSQVLTNVPAGAVFTDTVYDDSAVVAHIATITGNPHAVSVNDLGLNNVDNTSDLDKPISTATQTALNAKQDKLMTDFDVSTAYTFLNSDTAKTAVILAGGSVTLDSTADGGITTGSMLQILNNRGSDLSITIAGGDTVIGDNIALADGYFAYVLYLGSATWAISVGSVGGVGGGGDTTFIAHTDTPNTYVGSGGKAVAVKGTEDGVEFVDFQTVGVNVVSKSTSYTTTLAENGYTIVATGAFSTLTLDDTGLSVGFNQIVFNDTASNISVSSADTIKGGSASLSPGYFATYILIATGVWALSAPYTPAAGSGEFDYIWTNNAAMTIQVDADNSSANARTVSLKAGNLTWLYYDESVNNTIPRIQAGYNFGPTVGNTYDLGKDGYKWATLWSQAVNTDWLNCTQDPLDDTYVGNKGYNDTIYEGVLGNPASDGYILSSTAAGIRSWVAQSGGGNVSNSGTPLDNQIAVWTGATVIEGTSGLTYNGSSLSVTGAVASTDAVTAVSNITVNTISSMKEVTGTAYFENLSTNGSVILRSNPNGSGSVTVQANGTGQVNINSGASNGLVAVTGRISVTLDPTADSHVGDRLYNDGRYEPLLPTIRTISGTTDTLVLTDASKYLRCTNAAATAVTVPPNSSVAFEIGTKINIRQAGTGQVTITEGAGVTVNTEETLLLKQQHSTVTLIKVGTDEWDIMGSLELA